MKKINISLILAFLVILGLSTIARAQQDFMNTQFMYYKQGYNPANVGLFEGLCISGLYRNQWLGLNGAPQSQAIFLGVPVSKDRVGLGFNLNRNTVGITEMLTVEGVYAYHIRMEKMTVSFGLQTSARTISEDFQQTTAFDGKVGDNSIPTGNPNKGVYNFGSGLYLSNSKFFLGLSVPRILENNLQYNESQVVKSREAKHFYLMGGYRIGLSDKVIFQPQTLLRVVDGAPMSADLNLSFTFNDKIIAGTTWRSGTSKSITGESIDVMLGAQFKKGMLLVLSYDITLTDIRNYSSGSIEAMLSYCFSKKEDEEYMNPRFF